MNDFENLIPNDYGFKPQGKASPMVKGGGSANLSSGTTNLFADLGPRFGATSSEAQKPQKTDDFGDILGGSARYTGKSGGDSSVDFDSVFRDSGAKHSSLPIFDKPVYDDDIFEGVPGLKSSSSAKYDNVFGKGDGGFDDLLGGFSKVGSGSKSSSRNGSENAQKGMPDFDDLIPGFSERSNSQSNQTAEPATSAPKTSSSEMENPFSVFESSSPTLNSSSGLFTDPLEEITKISKPGNTKVNEFSASTQKVYDDSNPFDDLGKSVPTYASEASYMGKDKSPPRTETSRNQSQAYPRKEPIEKHSVKSPDSYLKKNMYVDSDLESHQIAFEMPSASRESYKSTAHASSPMYSSAASNDGNVQADMSPRSEEPESSGDIWLTVSEIPLFTKPTSAPPPSRPPPPIPLKKKVSQFTSISKSTPPFQSPRSTTNAAKNSRASSIDGLEEFATGGSWSRADEYANGFSTDDVEMMSDAAASAAAMKEAMDRAQAKFWHAREVRERESMKAARNRETTQAEKDEIGVPDAHERAFREKQGTLDRERDEEEREQRRLEKEIEEREKEQRRLEKEKERAREIERERGRQAVERATREARERAAVEARLRAERAAVEKAAAEARERAERAAVQRAQAEARERAAAGAKERAERVAAEAREREKERAAAESRERDREKAEARRKAERMAVERAAAEARERAAAEARQRAAAAAKTNQQNNDNDLESFFSMGRASSAPRPRSTSSNPFDTQYQNRQGPEPAKTSTGSSTNIRKTSSTANIVDELSSIFGAAPSSGEFQEIEGESEERRRARIERHQRTQERAAKALAEKNERDLQAQREQAERHRIAETLDVEIKRWAAGKEGNLRALLSTLQYVLWPECGWQPVSLTDLITGAAVKKAYRKATLCIHPDKVQQKGANLQQKYIAEKVFDLLKEAWNKFNSEELF